MKKILLLVAAGFLLGYANSGKAQPCDFGNLGAKVNSITPGSLPNTCVINFDLYFDIDHNSGGKYFWLHIWPTNQYPAWNYSDPPTTSLIPGGNGALDNSITTFGYHHFQQDLSPLTSYPPDANAPGFQSAYTLTEIEGTPDRYTAHNLVITLPQGCNIAQSLTVDAWQSQSAASQQIHCATTNVPLFLNDPTIIGGLLLCQLPRTYVFSITTLSAASKTVNYKVVIDNGDGVYNSGSDTIQVNSGSAAISSSSPFNSGVQGYLPYSNTKPYADRALWVIVLKNGIDPPNDIYARIDNLCIPLPVQFKSFTAMRDMTTVMLRWTTATELNNRGFYVERRNGISDWQTIAFVPSQALNGNSDLILNYSFTDINNLAGISLYRLRQVDIDERVAFSETRSVKGINQREGLLVYPNPARSGEFNLVMDGSLENADIKLLDMNGKLVKEWFHITQGRLSVQGVASGIYLLRAKIRTSGEEFVTKLILDK